jgi:hypothetical protein
MDKRMRCVWCVVLCITRFAYQLCAPVKSWRGTVGGLTLRYPIVSSQSDRRVRTAAFQNGGFQGVTGYPKGS